MRRYFDLHVELLQQHYAPGDTVEHDWPGDRVKDALALAAELRPDWDADYAEKLVDRFALPPKKRLGQLSSGQRSALGITLGLASRSPLTMLDESYLGMDAPSRYAFYDELLADFGGHRVVSTVFVECAAFYRADGDEAEAHKGGDGDGQRHGGFFLGSLRRGPACRSCHRR